ncbi:hypothetical protein [Paenibacillus senegalensis]|uniref:hypothetical protein n=1 Tax=Paenibacillus senegalensis TaxID=1465766 RepID=UPI000288F218|nr:hypothetical protein [Paenibacillus senegalensis]
MSIWKQRFFWTGLGSGIIAGALLLQLMTAANSLRQQENTAPDLLSEIQSWNEETWRAYAEQAGYTLQPSDTVSYSQSELDAEIEAAIKAYKEEMAAQTESGESDPSTENQPDPAREAAEPAIVQVGIRSGVLASEVADLLFELDIIADRDLFEQRMKDRRLTPNIRTGTYDIAQGEDIDTIIDLITFP